MSKQVDADGEGNYFSCFIERQLNYSRPAAVLLASNKSSGMTNVRGVLASPTIARTRNGHSRSSSRDSHPVLCLYPAGSLPACRVTGKCE